MAFRALRPWRCAQVAQEEPRWWHRESGAGTGFAAGALCPPWRRAPTRKGG
jgi:hypothetical protein